jgi:hypothetical protein
VRLTPNDVRDALRRHASDIVPDGSLDPLTGMDQRVRNVRRGRVVSMALTAVAVLLLVALVPTAVHFRERGASPSASPPSAAAPLARDRVTPPAATGPIEPAEPAVPVYYLSDNRLAREYWQLGDVPDPVAAAVTTMLSTPPHDRDYRSGWPASATAGVTTTTTTKARYAVDVSAQPLDGCLAVQQLVHTVTAAAGEAAPVVVRIAGRPVGGVPGLEACGSSSTGAVSRAPARDMLVPVQVSSPNEDVRVPRLLSMTGHSRVINGSLRWVVTDASTGEVLASDAPPTLGDSPKGWEIPIELPLSAAGREVDITVSGKTADGAPAVDTKRVSVAD